MYTFKKTLYIGKCIHYIMRCKKCGYVGKNIYHRIGIGGKKWIMIVDYKYCKYCKKIIKKYGDGKYGVFV